MKPGSHGESSAEKKIFWLFFAPRFFCVQKKKWFFGH